MSVNEVSARENNCTRVERINIQTKLNLIECLSDLLLIKVNDCLCIVLNAEEEKIPFFDWIPLKHALTDVVVIITNTTIRLNNYTFRVFQLIVQTKAI